MSDINPYSITDGHIVGPSLKIEAACLVEPERQSDVLEGKSIILDAIVDMLNGSYRAGRESGAITLGLYITREQQATEAAQWLTNEIARLRALLADACGVMERGHDQQWGIDAKTVAARLRKEGGL